MGTLSSLWSDSDSWHVTRSVVVRFKPCWEAWERCHCAATVHQVVCHNSYKEKQFLVPELLRLLGLPDHLSDGAGTHCSVTVRWLLPHPSPPNKSSCHDWWPSASFCPNLQTCQSIVKRKKSQSKFRKHIFFKPNVMNFFCFPDFFPTDKTQRRSMCFEKTCKLVSCLLSNLSVDDLIRYFSCTSKLSVLSVHFGKALLWRLFLTSLGRTQKCKLHRTYQACCKAHTAKESVVIFDCIAVGSLDVFTSAVSHCWRPAVCHCLPTDTFWAHSSKVTLFLPLIELCWDESS